jgi:hypothetical protein
MKEDQVKTVYKFVLCADNYQTVNMPPGSKVLTAQVQREKVCIWALVDPNDTRRIDYPVWVYGTAHPVTDAVSGRYVATVQLAGGALVYHVFVGLGA